MSFAPVVTSFSPLPAPEPGPALFPYTTLFRSEASPLLVVVTVPVTFNPPVVSFSVNAPLVVRSHEYTTVLQSHNEVLCRPEPVSIPVVFTTPALWLIA